MRGDVYRAVEVARRSLVSSRRSGACGEGAELKWGGRSLRNGAGREYAIIFGRHGAGVGYVYARVDVSFGRLGEALSAG